MDSRGLEPVSDSRLIRAFTERGDRPAFETLVRRHMGLIDRNLILLFRGDLEDAADARQEVLVKLYRSLHRFRFRSSFTTYLYRLVRNTAIDILRKKGRERSRMDAAREELALVGPSEDDSDPIKTILRTEKRKMILDGIMRLKRDDRHILYLKDGEGLSLAEISRITGKPIGTLKSRLHRVRRKAAAHLEELIDGQ